MDRRSHIAALASALKVSETDLVGGPHLTPDPLQSDPHMGILALRVALQTNTLTTPAVDHARPLTELTRIVTEQIEPSRRACNYRQPATFYLMCLTSCTTMSPRPRTRPLGDCRCKASSEACICATFIAKSLNYTDLAHLAALRAEEAADLLTDPIFKGKAEFAWLHDPAAGRVMGPQPCRCRAGRGSAGTACRDPLGLQVLGMITLTASLAAASIHRGDAAQHWLNEAPRIAAAYPISPWPTGSRSRLPT